MIAGIAAGTRFGPYEIVAWLGAGGMGEVYRARDTRLAREVALKLIATTASADPGRVRRFEQEARAAAQLAHPNILAVHDIGVHEGVPFIVSELLQGESLRGRLARGGLPVRKALDVARLVADGLAAAHDKGIVHRDIKPDNIFLTVDGRVKILDFGIAKLNAAADEPGPAGSATETSAGTVVGTASYMSPEQVRGENVDGRSDIFSLGAVLYEMVTGTSPFTRATPSETMTAILNADPPDLDAAAIPPGVARVIGRCLEKPREIRYQSARDLAFGLEVLTGTNTTPSPVPPRRFSGPVLIAGLGVAVALAALAWMFRPVPAISPDPLSAARFSRFTDWPGNEGAAEISPDGKFVMFVADKAGDFDLWISQVASGSFTNLTETAEGVPGPSSVIRSIGFSADGSQVWMSLGPQATRRRNFLMPFTGGPTRPFLSVGDISPAWSPDGKRLAFMNGTDGDPVFVAGPMGVDPTRILKDAVGLHNHNPAWSPDGAWIYFVHGKEPSAGMNVWRVRPDGSGREQLTTLNTDANFIAPLDLRTILFSARAPDRSGPWLWAVDVATKVSRRVTSGLERYTSVSASRDGTRIVATVAAPSTSLWKVPILDRPAVEADAEPYAIKAVNPFAPRIAGASIFFLTERGAGNGLWRSDDGGEPVQVWSGIDGGLSEPAAVSRDGTRVVIVLADDTGRRRAVSVAADGTNPRTVSGTIDVRGTPGQSAADWSPDGQWIVMGGDDGTGEGLFKIPADGGAPIRLTTGIAENPVWSPDGAFIVYSAEVVEGRAQLLAVRPDGTPVKLPDVRTRPGAFRFTPDSRNLIFISMLGASNLQIIDLASQKLRPLTQLSYRGALLTFDVTSDGKQVVFDRTVQNADIFLIERGRPGAGAPSPAVR